MVKVSKTLLDQCTGMTFLALYDDNLGCFADDDGVNWWLEGQGREMILVNRESGRVPRDLAEELIAATTAHKEGTFALRNGKAGEVSLKLGRPTLVKR